jgi:hypothetical protein
MHCKKAGAATLITPELIATLCDHVQGNLGTLMNLAGETLAVATQREAQQIDEKLFLETCAPAPEDSRTTAMSLLPVEPDYRLAELAEEQRWLVTIIWGTGHPPADCCCMTQGRPADGVFTVIQGDKEAVDALLNDVVDRLIESGQCEIQ